MKLSEGMLTHSVLNYAHAIVDYLFFFGNPHFGKHYRIINICNFY